MAPKKIRPNGQAKTAERSGFPIVCIGASAGGLEAFTRLLEHLPQDTGMGFVIIQHLDPSHPSVLPPLLAKKSPLPVAEAREGARVQPNRVYVIPPDRIMTISKGILRLVTRSSEKKYMPIDSFMKSLAEDSRERAIGIILSGTATDGTNGLKAIKAEGGVTFAQDEKTAPYPGMPSSAIASGCVDYVLSPENIARELAKISRHPADLQGEPDLDSFGVPGTTAQFAKVFELLRKVTGLDFSSYKRTTIRRRIARRMTLHKFSTLDEYLTCLQKNRTEVESLSQDLLIKVTTFFRDSDAFDALKKKVFPSLLRHYKPNDTIRVWVPGCSTGEEVYSIGICLLEAIGDADPGVQCQIFATDISEAAIDRARNGFFTENIKDNVSPERLRRFFVKTAEGFRIAKSVRDMCIFARQDLTKDPPFSKLDLISCRNVLIYMGSDLQKRILPIFHYALKPGGYLMLGSAESTGPFGNLFTLADKKGKIYSKKSSAPGDARIEYPGRSLAIPTIPRDKKSRKAEIPSSEIDLFREADKITLTRFSPPGVLLNDELEVLQFRGHTGPFLEHAPGKPTVNILKLVKEGMVFELRTATEKAVKQGVTTRSQTISVRHNGHIREVVIEVVPIPSALSEKPFLLVLFNELSVAKVKPGKAAPPISKRAEARLVQQLRRELSAVREELQSVIEEQEAAQEEFKSANEEILSSNEELQSTNEELETAKEELQSANEELTTLNEELLTRNSELGQLNSDITNLLASINIPILMLSQDLRIRRFTPIAGALLNLIPSDVGRPITDINPNIEVPNLDRMVAEVIDTMSVREQEIRAKDGRWYSLRIRPYRTLENKIDGATVTFVDIDALKKSQQAEVVYDTLREPVLMLSSKMRILSANRSFYRLFGLDESAVLNRTLYEIGDGALNAPALKSLLEDVLPKRMFIEEFRLDIGAHGDGTRTLLLNARRIKGELDGDDIVLLAMEDVTNKKKT